MTKLLQQIGLIVGMAAAVASSSFAVFRWMDKQQDTDTSHTVQLQQQCKQDSIWKEEMLLEIGTMQLKVDSAIIIGMENQTAIYQNRSSYMRHIQSDESLTKDELLEILEPFMEEVKKNSTWTPYAGI